jgi:CRP-like cAMP-binding protein
MKRTSVGSDGPARLAAIEFFTGMSDAHLRMLARHVDELDADPGEVLMGEGEYGYEAIFVEQGAAEVRQGGELINTIGPGTLVGELAVIDGDGRRTASVIVSSTLRALSLTAHSVHEIRDRIPDLAAAIDGAADAHRERDRRRQAGASAD